MDSTFLSHKGFQEWKGFRHPIDAIRHSSKEGRDAYTPARKQNTIGKMKEIMK